jgi:hypothetical protein
MATSFTFVTSTVANTAPIQSTRVKVTANNTCYYAINTIASATANAGPAISSSRPSDVNMQGVGNFISIIPANGAVTEITVTQIGAVYASAVAQNSTTYLNP